MRNKDRAESDEDVYAMVIIYKLKEDKNVMERRRKRTSARQTHI